MSRNCQHSAIPASLAHDLSGLCLALLAEGQMSRRKWLQELRMRKSKSVLDRVRVRELSQCEAAEILGVSARTFGCRRDRWETTGVEGLMVRLALSP